MSSHQRAQRLGGNAASGPLIFLGILIGGSVAPAAEYLRGVAAAAAGHADYIEAVEQVFAELAFTHHLPKIHVGGGDDAHVHLNFLYAAQVHELAVLQHAQNLALRVHAHGADLVEEERARRQPRTIPS